MAELIYTYDDPPSSRHLDKAVKILEDDGVIALPAGTNWTLACDAKNARAIDRLYAMKPSHDDKRPLSMICSSISMATEVGYIDHQLYRYLKKIWPGPYTIITKRSRALPRQIKNKQQTVGIRIPASLLTLALVERLGGPLVATSVPLKPDGRVCQMGYEVLEFFGHAIDLIFDLGEELPGSESTVVDFTQGMPQVVRVGAGDVSIFL